MKEFSYVITDAQGIHARPAGLLVKEVKKFAGCKVTIEKNGKSANAGSVLGVMSLGAKQGETITVKADGDAENEAAAALEEFLKANL